MKLRTAKKKFKRWSQEQGLEPSYYTKDIVLLVEKIGTKMHCPDFHPKLQLMLAEDKVESSTRTPQSIKWEKDRKVAAETKAREARFQAKCKKHQANNRSSPI